MLRLAFLLLVILGALTVLIGGFVGMGLYRAAQLQGPPVTSAQPPGIAQSPPATASAPSTQVTATQPTATPSRPLASAPVAVDPPKVLAPADLNANGVQPIVLSAADATLIGAGHRLDRGGPPTIMDWSDRRDGLEWTAKVATGGLYDVEVLYACDRTGGGGIFTLRGGPGSVTASVRPTGGWEDYQLQYAGKLYLSQGETGIFVRPVYMLPGGRLMNLRSITLTFVKAIDPPDLRPQFRRRRAI